MFIPPPDYEARLDILRAKLRKTPLDEEAKEYLVELARSTEGFSGADLAEITQTVCHSHFFSLFNGTAFWCGFLFPNDIIVC